MDKFVYDIFHTIEVPTFVLSNVYHHHIGVINNIDLDSIDIKFNMATAQEVSCDVYKELNGSKCDLWDKIVGLRYIFIPEFKEYYKIDCSLDETNEIVKHLTLTSAGEYELSNKKILSLEINTESDILQDDYITTVFYDENNPRGSLLDRALADKAPDWSIGHVDETLKTIQRTFSVNNQSIYDFLTNTVAKEINCLFLFDSVKREISAYDLLNKCSDCGYRGEMLTTCTKCGGTNLIKGYGKDSNIFISADNYAEKITVDSNEDAVKNCFRVTGGDDYMNATIRNCNPNGSHYIYNFSEADYEDMPPQLTAKLIEYGEKYDELLPEYQEVVADYYDNLNSYYFYKTSMMPRINGTHWEAEKGYDVGDEVYVKTLPSWCYLECIQSGISGTTEFDATRVTVDQEFTDGTVIWQAKKNIISVPSAEQSLNDIKDYFAENDIYFQNNIPTAITEVNNEVKNIAGLTINSIFRIEIILDDYNKVTDGVWTGNIKVYNTGNTEDSITTDEPLRVNVRIAESLPDYIQYMSDKVEKRLSKVDTTFTELFKIEIPRDENYNYIAEDDTQFKEALHEYGLDMLSSFSKSYQGCIETLISNGITDEESSLLAYNLYNPMYVPYYARLEYISDEMAVRQVTVDEYETAYKDAYNKMQEYHKELDMKTFLGDELYKTLYNYIREDEYSNNNYISDGLSDGEVINDAKKLLEIANDELVKANTMQYTLSDTLVNLFNTKEFKDYKDSFRIGDYIICEADERLYRLRLIGVSYSYNSPDKINLTFSNFVALENYFSDAQNILSTAKTMSTSYGAVMHQVDKSADVTDEVSNWKDEGLSSATTTIKNNDNEEVIIDENGILAREYDDVTQTYSDEQMRITHNIIAFTDNAWETSTLGIGKQAFIYYNNDPSKGEIGWTEDVGYGINAKFVNSGYIYGTQIVAGEMYSENYDTGHRGSYINLNDGSFDLAGGGLIGRWNSDTHSYDLNYTGDVEGVLDVGVGSHLGTWTVYADGLYSGTSVIKPNNINVTGVVTASDFQMGSTLLSNILAGKQPLLNAGTNITLTPEQDGTVTISAAGGGGQGECTCHYGVGAPAETLGIDGDIYVEMSPDPSGCEDSITYNRSSNQSSITNSYSDGFHKIEGLWWTDRYEHSYTTYRIDGLTAGETYDVILNVKVKNLVQEYQSSSELFGIAIQNSGGFTTLSEHVKNGEFAYYEDGNDKIYFQSLKPMTTKVQSYSFKITAFSTTYLLISPDAIVNDSTIPMDIEIAISDGTIGNYIEDVYYKVEGEWLLYDNDTKYVAGTNVTITEVDGENVISATDTTYNVFDEDENGLVPKPQNLVGNDYSLMNDGSWYTDYTEYHLTNGLIGSSGGSYITCNLDESMTNGKYKFVMRDGDTTIVRYFEWEGTTITINISSSYTVQITETTAGLSYFSGAWRNIYADVIRKDVATGSGGSEVEANPSDPATDTLTTIGIDGTVYDIAGSGGGCSSSYVEEELYNATSPSFQNIVLDKSLLDYDITVFYLDWDYTLTYDHLNTGFVYTKRELEERAGSSTNKIIPMIDSSHISRYFLSSDGKTLTADTNNNDTNVRRIVGIKFGSGNGSAKVVTLFNTPTTTQAWANPIDVAFNTNDYDLVTVDVSSWDGNDEYHNLITFELASCNVDDTKSFRLMFMGNEGAYLTKTATGLRMRTSTGYKLTYNKVIGYKFGGGGSNIEPNPQDTPTDTLETIGIDGTVYDIAGSGRTVYDFFDYYTQNGRISNGSAHQFLTANFDKPLVADRTYIIDFKNSEDGVIVASAAFKYTSDFTTTLYGGSSIGTITMIITSTTITSNNYSGAWQDIYVDVYREISSAEFFYPVIYSTEEREIGVWTDNKPLYEKTIYIGAMAWDSSWHSTAHGISNIEKVVEVCGQTKQSSDGRMYSIPHYRPSDQQGISVGADTTNVYYMNTWLQYASDTYVTIQYTKTTDTPGGSKYNPIINGGSSITYGSENPTDSANDGDVYYLLNGLGKKRALFLYETNQWVCIEGSQKGDGFTKVYSDAYNTDSGSSRTITIDTTSMVGEPSVSKFYKDLKAVYFSGSSNYETTTNFIQFDSPDQLKYSWGEQSGSTQQWFDVYYLDQEEDINVLSNWTTYTQSGTYTFNLPSSAQSLTADDFIIDFRNVKSGSSNNLNKTSITKSVSNGVLSVYLPVGGRGYDARIIFAK